VNRFKSRTWPKFIVGLSTVLLLVFCLTACSYDGTVVDKHHVTAHDDGTGVKMIGDQPIFVEKKVDEAWILDIRFDGEGGVEEVHVSHETYDRINVNDHVHIADYYNSSGTVTKS
jgi:hypothetical protein